MGSNSSSPASTPTPANPTAGLAVNSTRPLPYIRDEDARALVEAAVELLIRDFGYTRAAERPKDRAKANGHDATGSADWAYLKANIRAGRDLHDSTRDYSAKLITSGMAEGAAVNLTRAELDNSQAPHDERWQEAR